MLKSHVQARRSSSGGGHHALALLPSTLLWFTVTAVLAGQVGFRLGGRLAARCVLIHTHGATGGAGTRGGGPEQRRAGLPPADALAAPPRQARVGGGGGAGGDAAGDGGAGAAGAVAAQQQQGQQQQEGQQAQPQAQLQAQLHAQAQAQPQVQAQPQQVQASPRGQQQQQQQQQQPQQVQAPQQQAHQPHAQQVQPAQAAAGPEPRYAQWAPYRVNTCEPGMPKHWAPCLHVPGAKVLLAEETIYPPFQMKLPAFVKQEHRDTFFAHKRAFSWQFHATPSTSPDEHNSEYLAFQTTHGQLWVFGSARYDSDPHPDGWNDASTMCLGHRGRVTQFKEEPPQPGDVRHEELMLANGPDPMRFQHHLDHNSKILAHGAHLLTPRTSVLAMRNSQPQPVVRDMWDWWPQAQVNQSRIVFGGGNTHWAERLIVPCRAPLIHPYPAQLYQATVLGADASTVSLEKRKYVVVASRSGKDAGRANQGRSILNEDKMIEALNASLQARGKGEILLVMYNQKAWPTYKDFALWMNRNVRALVGIHGGMLENLFWLAPHTTLLEVVPSGTPQWDPLFYYNSAVMELQYAAYPANSVEGESVNVDPAEVVKLLEQTLGVEPERPVLRHHYEWLEALAMAGRGVS